MVTQHRLVTKKEEGKMERKPFFYLFFIIVLVIRIFTS
jgi:hypothetical protein